ncbi:hypothetical protein HK101_010684 [Irineochytrium annulatum]|nr:hypothetical protein HK101_010684 [Irineochytrium annulatum]
MPEEALYLTERGELAVADETGVLTFESLHLRLKEGNPNLDTYYAVYWHYQSQGWVVKDGIKFGARFVLYGRGGPAMKHSKYAVIIDGDGMQAFNELYGAVRIVSQTRKVRSFFLRTLLLCQVTWGKDGKNFSLRERIARASVVDMKVERWYADLNMRERDE